MHDVSISAYCTPQFSIGNYKGTPGYISTSSTQIYSSGYQRTDTTYISLPSLSPDTSHWLVNLLWTSCTRNVKSLWRLQDIYPFSFPLLPNLLAHVNHIQSLPYFNVCNFQKLDLLGQPVHQIQFHSLLTHKNNSTSHRLLLFINDIFHLRLRCFIHRTILNICLLSTSTVHLCFLLSKSAAKHNVLGEAPLRNPPQYLRACLLTLSVSVYGCQIMWDMATTNS